MCSVSSLHPCPALFGELRNCSLFNNSHHWHFTFVISSPKSDPEPGKSLCAHRKSPWTGSFLPSQSGAPIKTEMVSQLTWNHRIFEPSCYRISWGQRAYVILCKIIAGLKAGLELGPRTPDPGLFPSIMLSPYGWCGMDFWFWLTRHSKLLPTGAFKRLDKILSILESHQVNLQKGLRIIRGQKGKESRNPERMQKLAFSLRSQVKAKLSIHFQGLVESRHKETNPGSVQVKNYWRASHKAGPYLQSRVG